METKNELGETIDETGQIKCLDEQGYPKWFAPAIAHNEYLMKQQNMTIFSAPVSFEPKANKPKGGIDPIMTLIITCEDIKELEVLSETHKDPKYTDALSAKLKTLLEQQGGKEKTIDDYTKGEIVELLKEKQIKFNPADKKEVLYNQLINLNK